MNLSPKSVKWKLIEEIENLTTFKVEWNELCVQTNDSFFMSPEWILNWISVFWQDEWQLKVILGFENNKLSIIMPLYIQERGIFKTKTLYPLGQGEPESTEVCSEYQDILIAKNTKIQLTDVARQLKNLNIGRITWQALLADSNLLKLTPYLPQIRAINSGCRYAIDRLNDPKIFLSKNNFSSWRKSKNKLQHLDAKFSWVPFNKTLYYWNRMKELHQKRWNKNDKQGAFLHEKFSQFHLQCVNENNIRISIIEVNNSPIAINYYYVANNTLYFYQSGWNVEGYANMSPGFALHVWSIQNNPFGQYDFMMGKKNTSYKNKFGCNIISNMYNIQTESIVKKLCRSLIH